MAKKDETKLKLVYFDTETTGKENGRLIQICTKEPHAPPCTLLYRPPVAIELEAMAVHHITEKMLKDTPMMTEGDSKNLTEYFTGKIAVAHNAEFDIGVMQRENVKIERYICTYKVVQTLYDLPMYKLQYLRYCWDIDIKATAHDAEGDVLVLERVFEKMVHDQLKKHKEDGWTRDIVIAQFEQITKEPMLLRKIMFGKHAGKTFEEILKIDKGYLDWLKSKFDHDPDIIYTVTFWLSGGQKRIF